MCYSRPAFSGYAVQLSFNRQGDGRNDFLRRPDGRRVVLATEDACEAILLARQTRPDAILKPMFGTDVDDVESIDYTAGTATLRAQAVSGVFTGTIMDHLGRTQTFVDGVQQPSDQDVDASQLPGGDGTPPAPRQGYEFL